MYKFRLLMVIILLCLWVKTTIASESPFSMHEDNYFIAGQDDAKFKVSAEYNIFYPFKSGLMVAYTEEAFWNIYNKSGPFAEYVHNPEIFYRLDEKNNIFGNSDLSIIDYITAGFYEHKSNGRDEDYSRGMDTYYGEIQSSIGSTYNAGLRIKVFKYYHLSAKNLDLPDYKGFGEGEVFFKIKNAENNLTLYKFYVKGGGNPDSRNGWFETGMIGTILTGYIQPKLYLSYYSGYMSTLISYKEKEDVMRFGLIFVSD